LEPILTYLKKIVFVKNRHCYKIGRYGVSKYQEFYADFEFEKITE